MEAALRKRPEERLHRHVQLISHWLGQQVAYEGHTLYLCSIDIHFRARVHTVALRARLPSCSPGVGTQFMLGEGRGARKKEPPKFRANIEGRGGLTYLGEKYLAIVRGGLSEDVHHDSRNTKKGK